MKKEYLILLVAGIFLVCLYKAGRKVSVPGQDVIKPGDKGNDVNGLQSALTAITGLQFSNPGAYDNETLSAVRYYMQGTSALIDYDKGYVSKEFAADLNIIQGKIKQ